MSATPSAPSGAPSTAPADSTLGGVQTGSFPAVKPGVSDDPEWFKTAVFYEVLVRSFQDSDGDGFGDFRGLTEKLDYLH